MDKKKQAGEILKKLKRVYAGTPQTALHYSFILWRSPRSTPTFMKSSIW